MKISLNWLKDYVSVPLTPEQLAHRLTMAGLEVEKVEKAGADTVFELEITPNRPDCLNMWGMAREVSAILNKARTIPKTRKLSFPKKTCPVAIEDKKGCSRYIGTVIEGVRVGPAEAGLRKCLEVLGLRSINNIVDITNFCLLETGQPMHAFDYDKLDGGKIVVRQAKKGEKIVTIDEVERDLDPSVLVIADAKRPVAIAGVMGGKATEVSVSTKNILLESAYFDPILVRRAARKLGLSTDSSYRFERGVDRDMVKTGCERAVSLILQQAGGRIMARKDAGGAGGKKPQASITISLARINHYMGASVTAAQCKNILQKLDFKVTAMADGKFNVVPPSFRGDIKAEVDIIEEVSRVTGYDNLPSSLPLIKATGIAPDRQREQRKTVSDLLRAQGIHEAVTYAMISQSLLRQSGLGDWKGFRVQNPLTQEQEMMRPSLLPNLLQAAATNLKRGQKDVRLFETGKIYSALPEQETLAIILTGAQEDDWRVANKGTVDFYDMKGALEHVFDLFEAREQVSFLPGGPACFTPGRSARVVLQDEQIGACGHLDKSVLNNFGIKQQDVVYASIGLESLYARAPKTRIYDPPSEYPQVVRDISLAVRKEVTFQKIKDIAVRCGEDLLQSVRFNEEYLGDKIASGQRGLVFSVIYQSSHKTLTDADVNAVHAAIEKALVAELGAVRR